MLQTTEMSRGYGIIKTGSDQYLYDNCGINAK